MTVREYISATLTGYDIPESSFVDMMVSGIDLEADITSQNINEIGKGIVSTVEGLLFSPRRTNISENGFSESWNYADLGKYYLWLCRRFGVTPSEDLLAMVGVNAIIEKTDIW